MVAAVLASEHYDEEAADILVRLAPHARSGIGTVHDRHVEGLLPCASWIGWFAECGLSATSELDQWSRDVFIAKPR